MKQCTIIGISDSRRQWFPPQVTDVIRSGRVFSGGKRHYEIMHDMLPQDCTWIDITVPLNRVFEEYAHYDSVIIFASGDPLFYGFANTVQRELPDCRMVVYPSFNSLQTLAHRMCLPYHDMHVVSLTGRPWRKFDEALIRGYDLVGVLTDKRNTPTAIAQRMMDFGYDNYTITVGENLGNETAEHIGRTLRVGDFLAESTASATEYDINCLILQRTGSRKLPFGIPEGEFHLLNGRVNMITKMPVRLLSLAMLGLRERQSLWDVGFCTGSVSIEARLQFPHLAITAFEIREEGRDLMLQNSRKFGAPGIETVIGDFLSTDISTLERPDAVFIGGHGGRLKEMLSKIKEVLRDGGCIVFNSVSEESRRMFYDGIANIGMKITSDTLVAIDSHNPIHIMKAE